jgi:lipopolysaccharide/colanic/teichoic acid biosynthesis glycosyltransferase
LRFRLPTSRAGLRIRLSPIDVVLAAAAPLAALYLRNVELVSEGNWVIAGSYSLVSLGFSLVVFQAFGISDTIPRYISVGDLLNVAKVVLSGQLMTAIVLFTVTRLDGIPRSVPAIQALVLGAGLVAYRGLINLTERRRGHADQPRHAASENVILIGLNDWSVLVMKFVKAHVPERWRVIALLDEETRWTGRSVDGVQVFGPPAQLEAVIEEFATHGVRTDRVVVGGEAGRLSEETLAEVQGVCARRDLDLVFMPYLLELGAAERADHSAHIDPDRLSSSGFLPDVPPSPYFRWKRIIDAGTAGILILWLLPLLVIGAIVVVLDVGSPVLFWQQRVGQYGRELQIYKLRTLRPAFDRRGQKIPEERRVSWIGRLLRQTRIDELPQLLNVLVGDMSLIGPRPLLPQDQPPNSAARLTVRPGITGWAQVNGGVNLSATEKDALDVWYICNASLALDLRILGMTLLSLLRGDRRSEKALAQAQNLQEQHLHGLEAGRDNRGLKPAVPSRFPMVVYGPPRDDPREAVATQSR